MNLFTQLLRLHRDGVPTEDFLTELARAALRHDPTFARDWLQFVGIPVSGDALVSVQSQVAIARLPQHESDSRIDIILHVHHESGKDLIFVEAKVSAEEGRDQLKRYAEILADRADVRQRDLVYLTARHDPKLDPKIENVAFRLARWHDFHRLLGRKKPNPLTLEILRFMESKGLSQGDRFSPTDIVALRNVGRVANLMHAILGDEVYRRMAAMTGWTYPDSTQLKKLREHGGWTLEARWDVSNVGLTIGFLQPENDDPAAYPVAVVFFWVMPKARDREALRALMRQTCVAGDWKGKALDDAEAWFGIRLEKPMEAVLVEPDQVKAFRQFFLEGLDKAEMWLNANANLKIRGFLPKKRSAVEAAAPPESVERWTQRGCDGWQRCSWKPFGSVGP